MEPKVGNRVKVQRVEPEVRDPWGTVVAVSRHGVQVRFDNGNEELVDHALILEVRKR